MTKNVKITVSGIPITSISAPLIVGTHGPVMLDTKDIFKCIIAGAKVVEVFEGYGEVVLTLANYDKDNTPYIKAAVVKTVMDDMSKDDQLEEHDQESENVLDTQETVEESEESDMYIPEETRDAVAASEESQTEEQPKSPDHWMPPQRDNNGQKNNNRNKGKRR